MKNQKANVLTVFGVLIILLASAGQVQSTGIATGNYYLDTPLPIAAFYIGTYTNGSYFAVNGSNWQNFLVSSNATYVINTCLDNLTPGRILRETVVLQGIFNITTSIVLQSNCILDLRAARIEVNADVDAITASSKSYFRILGGVIDGNKASRSGEISGIYLNNCYNVVVDGVEIREVRKAGIYSYNCNHCTFKNCYLYRCGDNGIATIYGIVLTGTGTGSDNIGIFNNYIDNNGDTGGRQIYVSANGGGYHIKIVGNTLVNPYDRGGSDAMINFQGSYSVIGDNILIGNGYTRTGIDVGHGHHNDIVGNYIEDVGDSGYRGGIHLTTDSKHDTVTGNTIFNCTRGIMTGEHALNPPTAYRNVISGNNIDGGTRGVYGIYGSCLYTIIVGNNVHNVTGYGIGFYCSSAQQNSYSMIHSNLIESCGTGIYELNHAYLSIHGNVIRDCTTYMTLEDFGSNHNITDNVDWHT